MPYRSIILHVCDDAPGQARLACAVELAGRFKARIVGVAAESYPATALVSEAAILTPAAGWDVLRATEEDFKAARILFDRRVPGADPSDWRAEIGSPAQVVAREARSADLVIASAGVGGSERQATAGELVMLSGRPVLVIPEEGFTPTARTVTVAWKDTRETRRAVADAMPFLMAADHVAVVEIAGDDERDAAVVRTGDVCRSLARHGVDAHPHVRPRRSAGTAETLLALAEEHGSDLLVAGAYGHSRLREWAFGGVTRRLLAAKGRALLVSH